MQHPVGGCKARTALGVSDSGGQPAGVPPDGWRDIAKKWLASRPITILGVLSSSTWLECREGRGKGKAISAPHGRYLDKYLH